jgi:hypothetical protein
MRVRTGRFAKVRLRGQPGCPQKLGERNHVGLGGIISHRDLANALPFSCKPAAESAPRFYTMSLRRDCLQRLGGNVTPRRHCS